MIQVKGGKHRNTYVRRKVRQSIYSAKHRAAKITEAINSTVKEIVTLCCHLSRSFTQHNLPNSTPDAPYMEPNAASHSYVLLGPYC